VGGELSDETLRDCKTLKVTRSSRFAFLGRSESQSVGRLEGLAHSCPGCSGLVRYLGLLQLAALGQGAMIGAGIFLLTGKTAAAETGPAILIPS
jgi:hypothetical protein